jgi:uncharacterized protein
VTTPGSACSSSRSSRAGATGSTGRSPTREPTRSSSTYARRSQEHADPLLVDVREAFPNCPKYISRRHLTVGRADPDAPDVQSGSILGEAEWSIIGAADVCFIASANPGGNLDASHRGGRPGFVRRRGEALWVPDYRGNSMFNTLGNLTINPAAGMLFIDFAAGVSLQLTGATAIDLEDPDADGRTGGTGRAWTLTPSRWRRAPLPARIREELIDLSPFNP